MTRQSRIIYSLFVLLACSWMPFKMVAQCSGCGTVISTNGGTSFTVSPGQTVCVNSGVTYTGIITVNGGVLCNQGQLTRINFKKGVFNNYGTFSKTSGLTINATGPLEINCFSSSVFSVTGAIAINNNRIPDSLIIRLSNGAFFTSTGALSLVETNAGIYIGQSGSPDGSTLGTTGAVLNTGAGFSIGDSSNIVLVNEVGSFFNVAGSLSMNSTGNKMIRNSGFINVNNAISLSGTANSGDLINLTNDGTINTTNNFNAATNNANINVTNNEPGTIFIGGSMLFSKLTQTLSNLGSIVVNLDATFQYPKIINSGSIIPLRDCKFISAQLNNSNTGSIIAGRHFVSQNSSSVTNNGSLKSGTDFRINSSTFNSSTESQVIAQGTLYIQTGASVINSGSLTAVNVLNVSSSTLTNSNTGIINGSISALFLSGSESVNNGTIQTSSLLRISGSTLQNNRLVSVTNGTLNLISSGVLINADSILVVGSILQAVSRVENNSLISVQGNYELSTTTASLSNNGIVISSNDFINNGKVNLGTTSVIDSKNYFNLGSGANISGPVGISDTLLFPKIVVYDVSQNTGFISGKIIFYDLSLVSTTNNIGFGFDQVSNPTRISTDVLFIAKAIGPGNGNPPVVLPCPVKIKYLYSAKINVFPKGPICPGQQVILQAMLYYSIFNGTTNIVYFISPQLLTFAWIPPPNYQNPNQQTQIVYPLVPTTYDVQITYLGCTWIAGISVNVQSPVNYFVTVTGAPDIVFPHPDGVTVVANVTGGTPPYTYAWTPTQFVQIPSLQNPQMNPPFGINYTVTVADAVGCLTSTTVNLIPAPYAPLNKVPDGGYYKLINNRMLFKIDGQYAITGLVYNVYNLNNQIVSSNANNNFNSSLMVNSGDNRYSFNATTLPTGYYTLEVINEKKERLYLRFIR